MNPPPPPRLRARRSGRCSAGGSRAASGVGWRAVDVGARGDGRGLGEADVRDAERDHLLGVVAREADVFQARRTDRAVEELLRVGEDAVDEGQVGRPRDEGRERRVLPGHLLLGRESPGSRDVQRRLRLRVDLLFENASRVAFWSAGVDLRDASSTTASGSRPPRTPRGRRRRSPRRASARSPPPRGSRASSPGSAASGTTR